MERNDSIANQSAKSFEQILMQYQSMLYRLCNRYSSRQTTAEDLMQDVAVALWRQREKLWTIPKGVQQKSWVWVVARNAIINTIRQTPAMSELDDDAVQSMPDDDSSLIDSLYEQISLLDEPDRSIVKLQLAGYSYDEIAAKLKMTTKNVSVRLVRTKEKLRQLMNK